ncbi:DMT family transporter [[Mycobacterium] nativiensis]|uniref:DMT family transporter n=1 Tax=[Mycobacterium] nativiensis TaxID=2855503 RepID=A0ABU5XSF6_9MYCO|nr:DMT family transporter [Mycolicibacter sp. MYC340]MEB3030901.1 DMT family transporter [Mycolicibacter sp. MYC340]
MAKETIAVLLALGAALFIAISDVTHQRSAQAVSDEQIGHVALFTRLLADRSWWLGSLVAAVGFVLQAAALGLGSVLLVESLLVTSLLFALPISARQSGRRLGRSVWLWAALLVAAETVIITVGNPTAGQSHASPLTWAWVFAVLGPVVVLCLLGARMYGGRAAAVLLAVLSATSWGIVAVLTKGVVESIGHGLRPLLASPELYACVAVAVAGTIFQQSSFRAGALTASLPTMTVLEPMVAAGLGMVLLGEVLRPSHGAELILALAVAVLVCSVAVLSRDEAVTEADPVPTAA